MIRYEITFNDALYFIQMFEGKCGGLTSRPIKPVHIDGVKMFPPLNSLPSIIYRDGDVMAESWRDV